MEFLKIPWFSEALWENIFENHGWGSVSWIIFLLMLNLIIMFYELKNGHNVVVNFWWNLETGGVGRGKCISFNFGLRRCRPRVSLGFTFHAPRSARECEGMNLHTPKWAPTLGMKILMDFQIFKGWLQGSKLIGLKRSLYHWKDLGT
jgi:hypothetical protein